MPGIGTELASKRQGAPIRRREPVGTGPAPAGGYGKRPRGGAAGRSQRPDRDLAVALARERRGLGSEVRLPAVAVAVDHLRVAVAELAGVADGDHHSGVGPRRFRRGALSPGLLEALEEQGLTRRQQRVRLLLRCADDLDPGKQPGEEVDEPDREHLAPPWDARGQEDADRRVVEHAEDLLDGLGRPGDEPRAPVAHGSTSKRSSTSVVVSSRQPCPCSSSLTEHSERTIGARAKKETTIEIAPGWLMIMFVSSRSEW